MSCMTTTDDPIEKRINTVGRLLPHVEAKVVDPFDRTKILATGILALKEILNSCVFHVYWHFFVIGCFLFFLGGGVRAPGSNSSHWSPWSN